MRILNTSWCDLQLFRNIYICVLARRMASYTRPQCLPGAPGRDPRQLWYQQATQAGVRVGESCVSVTVMPHRFSPPFRWLGEGEQILAQSLAGRTSRFRTTTILVSPGAQEHRGFTSPVVCFCPASFADYRDQIQNHLLYHVSSEVPFG